MRAFSLANVGWVGALPAQSLYADWSAGVGVAAANGRLTSWTDSVSGLVATPVGAGPLLNAAGLNGRPSLYFEGSHYLEVPALDLSAGDGVTIAVTTQLANAGAGLLLEQTSNFNDRVGAIVFYQESGPVMQVAVRHGAGYVTTNAPMPANTASVSVATYDTQLKRATVSVNATTGNPVSVAAYSPIPLISAPLYIGARAGGVAPVIGHVARIRIYRTALSPADLLALRQALNQEYDLPFTITS